MTSLEQDLAKVVLNKHLHVFTRAQALKILLLVKVEELKKKARWN